MTSVNGTILGKPGCSDTTHDASFIYHSGLEQKLAPDVNQANPSLFLGIWKLEVSRSALFFLVDKAINCQPVIGHVSHNVSWRDWGSKYGTEQKNMEQHMIHTCGLKVPASHFHEASYVLLSVHQLALWRKGGDGEWYQKDWNVSEGTDLRVTNTHTHLELKHQWPLI